MNGDLKGWADTRDKWVELARRSRSLTPTHRVDQFDTWMRDVTTALGVDLRDPKERHAVIAGASLILCGLTPTTETLQVAANVLGTLVAPWWEDEK